MKRRSASPSALAVNVGPRNISRWLLPVLSTLSLLMNVALFWSFNETTYDTYSGLRAATELEAREVDQLWEHGKSLRSQVQQMQMELDTFKASVTKEQQSRRGKAKHTFNVAGSFLMNAIQNRRATSVKDEGAAAAVVPPPENAVPPPVDNAVPPPAENEVHAESIPDIPADVEDMIDRHNFRLSRGEAEKAMKIKEELTRPTIKKFRLSAKQVVEAAKLAGKSNSFKLSKEDAQKALGMNQKVVKKFRLPADQAKALSGSAGNSKLAE